LHDHFTDALQAVGQLHALVEIHLDVDARHLSVVHQLLPANAISRLNMPFEYQSNEEVQLLIKKDL